jgi:hypothetical protein
MKKLKKNPSTDADISFLPHVPALTTEDERGYLYWLLKDHFQNSGVVVEVGTWFGASAYALAAGIRDSGQQGTLYCFDRFVITGGDVKHAAEQGHDIASLGKDSLQFVQENLAQIYDKAVLVRSEIANITWDKGPIEVLHLDAPKRWSDILYALKVFGPWLIPGKSVVIAQDFCLPRAYALPLIFHTLYDSFELVHIPTEYSTMATFKVNKVPVVDQSLTAKSFEPKQAAHIFDLWSQIFSHPEQKQLLKLGLAFYYYDVDLREIADAIIKEQS